MSLIPTASIIIPTYNRGESLGVILSSLSEQQLSYEYELILVNDGSADNTIQIAEDLMSLYSANLSIKLITQDNQGQAVARDRGVKESSGRILIFLDDDMQACNSDFLKNHIDYHIKHPRSVVYGTILPPQGNPSRPAFERFYERSIETMYKSFMTKQVRPSGQHYFSANVSMDRSIYEEAGGFDSNYRHAEDREFGLRIESKTDAKFYYCPEAKAYHNSQTGRFASFIKRAQMYGSYDYRMSLLYPRNLDLSPFRFIVGQNLLKSLYIAIAENSNGLAWLLTKILVMKAKILNSCKLYGLASFCCSLIYIMNYVLGLRSTWENAYVEIREKGAGPSYQIAKFRFSQRQALQPGKSIWHDFFEDGRLILKYEDRQLNLKSWLWLLAGSDAFMILFMFRIRKLSRKYHIPLVNRLLRFMQTCFYSIELGIDIELGHGVYFIHSLGTVVGGQTKVGKGVVFMGNNTLGAAHKNGPSPTIGKFCTIGAGSRVLGDIVMGDRSTLGANSVLLQSIPESSVAVGAPARVLKDKIGETA